MRHWHGRWAYQSSCHPHLICNGARSPRHSLAIISTWHCLQPAQNRSYNGRDRLSIHCLVVGCVWSACAHAGTLGCYESDLHTCVGWVGCHGRDACEAAQPAGSSVGWVTSRQTSAAAHTGASMTGSECRSVQVNRTPRPSSTRVLLHSASARPSRPGSVKGLSVTSRRMSSKLAARVRSGHKHA